MKISQKGKKLLAEWEGSKPEVYKDSAGLDTIGVGHLLTEQERETGKIGIGAAEVEFGSGLNEEQVLDLLSQDLKRFEKTIDSCVDVELNQNQYDALVAFCFNVGTGAFRQSTLLKELNQGNYDSIPSQLKRWVHAGDREVPGLVNRRNKEIDLWNT